jgi:hypothetical protein
MMVKIAGVDVFIQSSVKMRSKSSIKIMCVFYIIFKPVDGRRGPKHVAE